MGEAGQLLSPYKALGLVSGEIPLVLRRMPKKRLTVAFCAVGGVVQQYNAQTLRIISVSDPLPSKITALAADRKYVYAAYGAHIAALHLSRQVKHRYVKQGHKSTVTHLLPFGDHLVSMDSDRHIIVWEIETEEVYCDMNLEDSEFQPSSLSHPATYQNKIFVGSVQGPLRLLNIKTGKVVHRFKGWKSGVTCLEQTPAIDVVAIGLKNGRIYLHNLKFDETIMNFIQEWGEVARISFRTDGPPVMMSTGNTGHIAVWDLEEKKVIGQIRDAHRKEITGLASVAGEAVFLSSSPDNSLRTWIFDLADGLARQLAAREGHGGAATTVRFHSPDGEMLVSAGEEGTVRAFSVWKDAKQENLGTAGTMSRQKAKRGGIDPETVRLPPVVALFTDTARESTWDNIVCCHSESPLVTSWTSRRHRIGSHKFLHPRFESEADLRNAVATSAVVSACGNFVMISYTTGHVDVFNVQSGIFRGTFKDKGVKGPHRKAHSASISGICVDGLNQLLLSGCSEGKLKFWNFTTKSLIGTLCLTSSITLLEMQRQNSLVVAALQKRNILIVDSETRKIVRRFNLAHSDAISDMGLSFDGKWLFSSAHNGEMKVWDLPTASLIESLKFKHPCTSLTASPTGEYIATSHKGQKGIYLWVNKRIHVPSLTLRPISADTEIPEWELPNSGYEHHEVVSLDEEEVTEEEVSYVDPAQLDAGLISTSGLAAPRWMQLFDMNVVRERNKPKEPPKKPEAAPFFLPTVTTTQGFQFQTSDAKTEGDASQVPQKKIVNFAPQTAFTKCLSKAENETEYRTAFELLKSYGPARIDSEVAEIGQLPDEDARILQKKFLVMINQTLSEKLDFELAQSYLSLFLKTHRDALWDEDNTFMDDLNETADLHKDSWKYLDATINDCLCVVQWLKSAVS